MGAKIPKVNEENVIIGETTITEARENGWPRRVARVLVFDQNKNLLLQKRSLHVYTYPGLWDCSGGHVDLGESYAEAGRREIKEELGIVAAVEECGDAVKFENMFSVACIAHVDNEQDFTLDPKEVEKICWISVEEFERVIVEFPEIYAPWLLHTWNMLRDKLK